MRDGGRGVSLAGFQRRDNVLTFHGACISMLLQTIYGCLLHIVETGFLNNEILYASSMHLQWIS